MNENNYTIAEDFILPSKGEIYSPKFDPHIRLRSMTVRDELKRTNPQNTTVHKNLCEIIDSCLLTKLPVSCYDLAVGDYEYLLHKLRVVTYGSEYKMTVGCPHCTSVYETSVDLDTLKVRSLDLDAFKENLTITLPVTKKRIELYYQTPRSLDAVELRLKEFKKEHSEANYDPRDLFTLQELIKTVDDVKLSYVEIENFINNLPARDGQYILRKIEAATRSIGIDTGIDVTCSKCGGDIKTFFRFGPEFFRPTNDD